MTDTININVSDIVSTVSTDITETPTDIKIDITNSSGDININTENDINNIDINIIDAPANVTIDVAGEATGNVKGPTSAIDEHIAVFDGITGKLLKDGGVIPTSGMIFKWNSTYGTADPGNGFFSSRNSGPPSNCETLYFGAYDADGTELTWFWSVMKDISRTGYIIINPMGGSPTIGFRIDFPDYSYPVPYAIIDVGWLWGATFPANNETCRVLFIPRGMMADGTAVNEGTDNIKWVSCQSIGDSDIAFIHYSINNVSNPPTDAQLDTAFGQPNVVGAGFVGVLNDNNDGVNEYIVTSDGTSWWYQLMTKTI
jgi:hypothetical protein